VAAATQLSKQPTARPADQETPTQEDHMSGISGVSGSRERFNDEELQAIRKDESTSTIVNKARRDAGFKEADVSVRGDDRTLNEVLHDRKNHISKGEAAGGVIHAVEVAEAVGVASHAMHSLGRAPHVVLPVVTLAAAHVNMYEMEKAKAAMKDGATRDQLHAAILDRLEVPSGFRAAEMKRLDVSMTNQSASKKISDQFGLTDKALVATLQLHCDQGMHAARRMIETPNLTKDAFLNANPEVAKRYANDAAFHNGFDALTWAKKDSAATYDATIATLTSRDARYDAANVTYRM
jgi:hypothetical protein